MKIHVSVYQPRIVGKMSINMEERRRLEDKNWESVRTFITESRVYRAEDSITQKYQVENIELLKNQVKIQNGRVFSLEKWKEEIEFKIKQKKDNYSSIQTVITVTATIVMALSAIVVIFKK